MQIQEFKIQMLQGFPLEMFLFISSDGLTRGRNAQVDSWTLEKTPW